MRNPLIALLVVVAAAVATPVQAMTMPAADLAPGQTLSAGMTGLTYDAAFGRFTLGGGIGDANGSGGASGRIAPSLRGQVRFIQGPVVSAAGVLAVLYDPGFIGGRTYIVPEAGLTMSYRLPTFWEGVRLNVRLGATLTLNQGQNAGSYYPNGMGGQFPNSEGEPMGPTAPPLGNIFQRLAFGPTTGFGVGIGFGGDRYEVTAGGGTIVGLRVNF